MGPRRDKMNPLVIETHHIWTRCVRSEFLLGVDPVTGEDNTHRRAMVEGLVEYQLSNFAVECGTDHYLSNHLHGVFRNRPDISRTWSDEATAWRWKLAWPNYDKKRGWHREPTDEEIEALLALGREDPEYFNQLRQNLANLSWFMARVKQPISYLGNRDRKPELRGHFWQGRYGNRRLDSFRDVFTSCLYNDVQQVKAGIVDRLEDSDYSAIQKQIQSRARQAFIDMRQRAPRGEEEEEVVAKLESVFANCCFAPIEANAPLMTQQDDNPPPTELVLPAGYWHQQCCETGERNVEITGATAVNREPAIGADDDSGSPEANAETCDAAKSMDGDASTEGNADCSEVSTVSSEAEPGRGEADGVESDADDSSEGEEPRGERAADGMTSSSTGQAKSAGASGKRTSKSAKKADKSEANKRRNIHNRLKRKQRRRASRCSLLGVTFEEYHRVVELLAQKIVSERQESGPSKLTSNSSPDGPAGKPISVPRAFRRFSAWAHEAAAEQIERLIQLRAPPDESLPPP